MVTFAELRDAQPHLMATAADAWSKLGRDLTTLEDRVVSELTGPMRHSGWRGSAANSAFGIFDRLDDECELAALQVRNVSAVMRHSASEFERLRTRLLSTITGAGEWGLTVTADGQVNAPPLTGPGRNDPDAQDAHRSKIQAAHGYEQAIRDIVTEASDMDLKCARAIRAFGPHFTGRMTATEWNDATSDARAALELMGISPDRIPKPDASPQDVSAWWRGLTEEQRSLYLTAYPEQIGALNGMPTTARDDANRQQLRNLLGEPDLRTYNNDKDDPKYQRIVSLMNQLEAAEYGPPAQRLYLLGIDNQGDGRAIVSVGNPDTAAHTAVVVPGLNTELDDMGGQINRAGNLQRTSDDLTGNVSGDVAVIAWLGYDAPETSNALSGGRADDGAPVLDAFVNGLRVSHEPGGSHVTMVGHSYGSTVVGTAASQGDGLAVDDIVVAGSPGMRVDHVSDLNVDARHVWAGAAQGDDVSGWMSHFAHNNEPHKEDFGANRFVVDTTGHSDYWKPDSQSLLNQARIVTGMYDRVDLEHGQPPQ